MIDRTKTKELLDELDDIARDYDAYDYGLPLHNEEIVEQMINKIKEWLSNDGNFDGPPGSQT